MRGPQTPALGCPVREDFDPLSAEFLADPYAVLASLPVQEMPVFYAPSIDYYVVTRYADVESVFLDPGTSSAAAAQLPLVGRSSGSRRSGARCRRAGPSLTITASRRPTARAAR